MQHFGQDLLALLELDPNQIYVPLSRLCSELGLAPDKQLRRIRAHGLLKAGLRTLSNSEDESQRPEPHLRVDLVALWLALVDSEEVAQNLRPSLERYQRECASILWQSHRPQGFSSEDAILPPRHRLTPAEQGYLGGQATATLARHQMQIERELDTPRDGVEPDSPADIAAITLARAVRRVATDLSARTRRNEYAGIYDGLYRQFGISSYRRMPSGRLHEALEWLSRWHGDLMGEPEPPPDI